jgi:hypothetical protein
MRNQAGGDIWGKPCGWPRISVKADYLLVVKVIRLSPAEMPNFSGVQC